MRHLRLQQQLVTTITTTPVAKRTTTLPTVAVAEVVGTPLHLTTWIELYATLPRDHHMLPSSLELLYRTTLATVAKVGGGHLGSTATHPQLEPWTTGGGTWAARPTLMPTACWVDYFAAKLTTEKIAEKRDVLWQEFALISRVRAPCVWCKPTKPRFWKAATKPTTELGRGGGRRVVIAEIRRKRIAKPQISPIGYRIHRCTSKPPPVDRDSVIPMRRGLIVPGVGCTALQQPNNL